MDLAELVVRLKGDTAHYSKSCSDVVGDTDRATSSVSHLGGIMKGALVAGAVAGAAAIVALAGSVVALGAKVIQNADELQKLADKTGLSAERLQELQFIGEDLGVDLDTLAGAQAKLTKSMDAARDGTGKQAEAFKALGISVTDSNGNLRDAKTVMMEAFDSLGKVGNETERDALAMKIFGKSAQDLNPIIVAGSGVLGDLAQQARDTGAVMSNEAVAALDMFGDSWDHAKQAILGMAGEALAPMMPQLQELVGHLLEHVGPAMEWVTSTIIPALTGGLGGEGTSGLGGALSGIMGIVGIVKDVFVMAWPLIKQAVQMFIDFLTGPTGQAIIKGLLEAIGMVLEAVSLVFQKVWPLAQQIIQTFIDFFNGPAGQKIIATLIEFIGVTLETLQSVFEAVWPIIQTVVEAFLEFFNSDEGQWLIESLLDLIVVALHLVEKVWGIVWKGLEPVIRAITPILKAAFAIIMAPINAFIWALEKAQDLYNWFKGQAGGPQPEGMSNDVWLRTLNETPSKQHGGPTGAGGLVLTHPNEYVLTEGDTSLMQRLTAAIAGGGLGGGLSLNVVINLATGQTYTQGQQAARGLVDELDILGVRLS